MFTKINLKNYERAEQYNHFMKIAPCTYSVTANLDITEFLPTIKGAGKKLYPCLIYLIGKVINNSVAFRHDIDSDGDLGYYDCCHPSYTIPNATKAGFSGIWTEFSDNFEKFYAAYNLDVQKYKESTKYAPKDNQPHNTFYVSCTPDLAFTSLTLNLYNGAKCLTPMFTIGKYNGSENKILLPLSASLHHAVCDGNHVAKFYEDLQAELKNLI